MGAPLGALEYPGPGDLWGSPDDDDRDDVAKCECGRAASGSCKRCEAREPEDLQ